jgi:uncharacterized CHY-type Zn-finger protein
MASGSTLIKCVNCRKRLSEEQRTASHTCPKCNHRGTNALKTVEVFFVYSFERPWYVRWWHRWVW